MSMRSLFMLLLSTAGSVQAANELSLRYDKPALLWEEALPVGNGRLGAMVFGGTAEERIQFNEDTLWSGQPQDYQHPGAAEALPEIRRLLFAGKQKEAEQLAAERFMSVPLRQEAYQPCGDLLLTFAGHDSATDYERSLDLETATAAVSYRIGDTRYRREVWASYPDKVIVVRVSADRPGQVNLRATLTSPHADYAMAANPRHILNLTGRVSHTMRTGTESRMRFAASVQVRTTGGRTVSTDDAIEVTGADEVVLLLCAATSYVDYQDISADPRQRCRKALQALAQTNANELALRHLGDYRPLFQRVSLDLGSSAAAKMTTNRRIADFAQGGDPQLATLAFQYGRYLLIASSRPGSHPANLQGLWNHKTQPSWDSKYTVNINTEMNYWPAELTNLPECHLPLFDLIEDCSQTGAKTARTFYDAPGWVLHHNTDGWRGTAPINASNHGIWPTGGAWLCQHLWWHYLYTLDRDFLRERGYPLMKQAAEFFLDYLVEDPRSDRGWLISGPSNSPENGGLVMGPTMDHQIIRDLFANCIEAAGILGIDEVFREQLATARHRIAPNQIGRYGQLQEWLEDKDDPKNKHRHVSHLWGLHPGREISEDTPELWAAARQSLEFRGDEATGWSMGWKVNFWARLKDGDRAHRLLTQWLRPAITENNRHRSGVYPNLFDAHPPFQIDGNFGVTAGIAEMLLQSHRRTAENQIILDLLPALPAAWPDGKITGLRARGGFEVDIVWAGGALVSATLHAAPGRVCQLQYRGQTLEIRLERGEKRTLSPKDWSSAAGSPANRPNIVFILADDMGYGDIQAYNPQSQVPTPALNRLAREGVMFTDAHSGSAVCTPTRYGVITGRYCWRSRLKRGVLNGFSEHLIDPDRFTVADLLKQAGYRTACIGKWHLGMDLPFQDQDKKRIDYTQRITNSPNVYGFDTFYGVTASLDFPPYVYVENDRFVEPGSEAFPGSRFPRYLRAGPKAPGLDFAGALDHLTRKAVDFIEGQSGPYFLYFPLTAPHKPCWPAPRFEGRTGIGPYGDFVTQVDWVVGQIEAALERSGQKDHTLIIYSSDNGSYMRRIPSNQPDHRQDATVQGYHPEVHTANAHLRGTKADVWEAGHRVPFIVRWPGKTPAGKRSDKTICLTDLMATCADVTGQTLPPQAGEDSYSFLTAALGRTPTPRAPVVNHSANGVFALRDGPWKMVFGSGSGGREQPRGKPFERPYMLFNLDTDPGETDNCIDRHPEIAARLEAALERVRRQGREIQVATDGDDSQDGSAVQALRTISAAADVAWPLAVPLDG
jgi:alpha-L-fucosidase 2